MVDDVPQSEQEIAKEVAYNPSRLFDALIERLQLKNDRALAAVLEVAPPVISKMRHHRTSIGATILLRMHDASGLTIAELRHLMGDRRTKLRASRVEGKPDD